ncbi:MAG: prohibitin family protein [Planctomycetaceae bacterium]|nr:prohibitin family protein [Planctomycetaceae bacterium]
MPKHHHAPNQVNSGIIILGALALLFIVGIFNSIEIVQPGSVGIVVRLGEAQPNALDEGLHFVIPFITYVHKLNVRIQKEEVKTAAASNDLQMVNAAIVVNYRVDPGQAVTLFREIGVNYLITVINPGIQEAFKAEAAKYTAEELITERATVSVGIRESISSRLETFGVFVDAVSITDFDFSPEFNAAIEAKVTAAQRALQAERELERYRFEAQQKVVTAEGEADAIMAKAKAEAEALGLKKQYATMELIWLSAVEKWDGKLPTHLFAGPSSASPTPVFEIDR